LIVMMKRRRDNLGEPDAIPDAIRPHDPSAGGNSMRRHATNAGRQRLAPLHLRRRPACVAADVCLPGRCYNATELQDMIAGPVCPPSPVP
jgi:hypothetical protein